MLVDTHLHLENDDNIELILKEALLNDVKTLIISGCDKESIINGMEIIKKYKNIYMTIGFHPSVADCINDKDLEWLKSLLNNKKIIGIGEIGLDYYYGKDNKEQQLALFEKQLLIADELNLPVVIHSRDAFQDTYDLLKKHNLRGSIHCFSGNIENANAYIKLGYYIGIGGVVTFGNSKLKEVLKEVDLTKIILETDSPYLCPLRGKRNSPKYIRDIALTVANIKNITLDEVSLITTNNVISLFDIGEEV